MPTRDEMNSVGQPFLALRREPNKAVTPDAWLHAEQDMRIAELETVAGEWQAVAEDKQIQLDAARRRIGELERDARSVRDILSNLRQANKDFAAAAIKPDEPMTAAEVRAGQAVATLRPASPPEPVFNVPLFEPVAAPAVPNAMIGRLKVSADMWDRIGGVGRYAGHGAMDVFGATHGRRLSVQDYPCGDVVALVEGVHAITCRRIPIWNSGRDTYQWRAVVESADDRELVRRLGGEWWA